MQRSILAMVFACSLLSCNNEKTTSTTETDKKDTMNANTVSLTEQEKTEGWVSLFDGQSTANWHKYGGGATGSAWKAEDGTLHLDASQKEDWQIKDGGDIVSNEEFENFHLKVEWKIDTGGNSGIMFYVHEDKKYKYPWETGPEMQVLDNALHADAKIPRHKAGDLYDIIASSKETVKPALEWNAVEIKALNGKLDFRMNGENIVSTTLWDDNWKKLLKDTKWVKYPDFATYKKGRIALQDHGNHVWFRNIKIRKL